MNQEGKCPNQFFKSTFHIKMSFFVLILTLFHIWILMDSNFSIRPTASLLLLHGLRDTFQHIGQQQRNSHFSLDYSDFRVCVQTFKWLQSKACYCYNDLYFVMKLSKKINRSTKLFLTMSLQSWHTSNNVMNLLFG